ncbi:MAG: hypothetical protein ACYS9T_04070 [Planctomycetota bacterium]
MIKRVAGRGPEDGRASGQQEVGIRSLETGVGEEGGKMEPFFP